MARALRAWAINAGRNLQSRLVRGIYFSHAVEYIWTVEFENWHGLCCNGVFFKEVVIMTNQDYLGSAPPHLTTLFVFALASSSLATEKYEIKKNASNTWISKAYGWCTPHQLRHLN